MASGPLDGVRVLEFAQIYAGPLAGLLMADLGAEVLKVESFEGDPWRHYQAFAPFESKGFHSMNRGKKSIAVDLKQPSGLMAIQRLVAHCDVVITNLRPDVLVRLGIDYDALRRIRPDLVYALSTAWGAEGPGALEPAFDLIAQAASGLMAGAGRVGPRGNPVTPGGAAYVDYFTGYSLALAVCAAMVHRQRTGEGQLVETSMLVNTLMVQNASFMSVPAVDREQRDQLLGELTRMRELGASFPEQMATRRKLLHGEEGTGPYYRSYFTRDGAIAVGGLGPQFRKRMQEVLGIAGDSGLRGEELVEHIERVIREHPTEHWLALFRSADVPVTPIHFIEEMEHHPQVQANGYAVELEHATTGPQTQVGPVHKMSVTPPSAQGASPPLGANTREILELAGYDAAAIDALYRENVVR
jgi:alpha-methylacyl-CoA racemase